MLAQLRRTSDLISAQRLPDAESELERAQAVSPRDLRVLKLLALVRFKLGRLLEARDVYRLACEIAPEDATVRLNLGLIALKLESFAEASVELEAAVRLQPDDRRAWSYLGYAYARSAAPAQAATAFRRAGQHELAAEMERSAAPGPLPETAVVEGETSEDSARVVPTVATPRPAPALSATPMPERLSEAGAASVEPVIVTSLSSFTTARLLNLEAASQPVEPLGRGVVRFAAGAQAYVRESCLLVAVGGQTLSLARRRSRGQVSDQVLATGGDRFFRVDGGGDVLLRAPAGSRGLVVLALDRDVLYLDEERVAAWGDDVVWESGAVPGGDKPMLQFRGSGRVVVLAASDEIVAVPLTEAARMVTVAARIAGWLGRVVVQGARPDDEPATGLHHVTCEGEGVLLLARHAQHP